MKNYDSLVATVTAHCNDLADCAFALQEHGGFAATAQEILIAVTELRAACKGSSAPGPWVVLIEDAEIDYTRLLDVVLSNGVYLMQQRWSDLDWTHVRDWRYSSNSLSGTEGGAA